jgi:hypothetical protein
MLVISIGLLILGAVMLIADSIKQRVEETVAKRHGEKKYNTGTGR